MKGYGRNVYDRRTPNEFKRQTQKKKKKTIQSQSEG